MIEDGTLHRTLQQRLVRLLSMEIEELLPERRPDVAGY